MIGKKKPLSTAGFRFFPRSHLPLHPLQFGPEEVAVVLEHSGVTAGRVGQAKCPGPEPVSAEGRRLELVENVLPLSAVDYEAGIAQGGEVLGGRGLGDAKATGNLADRKRTAAKQVEYPLSGFSAKKPEHPGAAPAASMLSFRAEH